MSDEAPQNAAESGATPGDAAVPSPSRSGWPMPMPTPSPDDRSAVPAADGGAAAKGGAATGGQAGPGGGSASGGAAVVSWPAPASADTGVWDTSGGWAPVSASAGSDGATSDPWTPLADHTSENPPPTDRVPEDAAPGGRGSAEAAPGGQGSADVPPVEQAPVDALAAGGPEGPAPGQTPASAHHHRTGTPFPAAGSPPVRDRPYGTSPVAEPANPYAAPGASASPVNPYAAPGASAPPVNPYAAPGTSAQPAAGTGDPFAPPKPGPSTGAPYAPPVAQPQGSPVPPPPMAPGGPGQVPYGYPGPSGYGYPAPPAPGPGYPMPPAAGPGSYGWPGMQPPPSNGLGTAGLVLGILSAIGFCIWPVAFLLGVLAVIFGGIGRGRALRGEATNPGQALAAIICGAAGIVLALVVLALLLSA